MKTQTRRRMAQCPLVAFAASLLLAGCATTTATHAPANAPAEQAIDDIITAEMAGRHIPGLALAVVADGRILYTKGYGIADLDDGTPVGAETAFLIASITKMFTATATMLLVQSGAVQLDAPIGDHLTDIPAPWRALTARQLLTHTSGLESHSDFDTPPCAPSPDIRSDTPAAVIAEISCLPLAFPPGTDWAYSDTGYLLLGLLIEQASGVSYEAFLQRDVFGPLGMRQTRLMAPIGTPDDRAVGYMWVDGQFVHGPDLSPVVEGASGGLVSTVDDLARFDGALARGDLLPTAVWDEMWQPVTVGSARYGMGFGLRPVGGARQVGHTGGGPAAATSFARFLDDGVTIIILTNAGQRPGTIQEMVAAVAATPFVRLVSAARREGQ